MNKVAILTYKHISLFELGCATELFSLPRPEIKNWYQTDVICFQTEALETTGGMTLSPHQVNHLKNYQTLVVPCWSVNQPQVPKKIASEAKRLIKRGGRIISFCSGAFFLAEIGLLNNRTATTHWVYAEQFKQRYPQVEYLEDILYQYDGIVGCSAGSAAAIDLGLEVIRQDYGHQICNQVAKRMVMSPHREGGQSQFVETPISKRPDNLATTLDWAVKNLATPIDVDLLAIKSNMSRRTFDRKFRAALNLSPKEWINQQRVHLAKNILETTRDPIEIVAINSGFENALTLRHNFRKYLQLSPTQYRRQFGRSKEN
ncbi:helix-turn-helix domain-containing protein [Aliikangiella coralliicola]|uniref:Helix-turn-helix domain-containing protein n=1 Tax=Aliikangiella coralliicola TaxID=2592383 RepID=A0A545UEI8_9GAMM|nr:helix-turn-helix domain-containing protein [Aliikangiella coralliicola]TQV87803.1 helix-turn-helix domain-containing protein [Aliikangiella coralliicola]